MRRPNIRILLSRFILGVESANMLAGVPKGSNSVSFSVAYPYPNGAIVGKPCAKDHIPVSPYSEVPPTAVDVLESVYRKSTWAVNHLFASILTKAEVLYRL